MIRLGTWDGYRKADATRTVEHFVTENVFKFLMSYSHFCVVLKILDCPLYVCTFLLDWDLALAFDVDKYRNSLCPLRISGFLIAWRSAAFSKPLISH